MLRLAIALLCFAFPAQATTITPFSLRYDTAPIFSYTVFGPGVPNDTYSQFLGQATSFELYLQLEGFYDELPDGSFLVEPGSPDIYFAEVIGPNGIYDSFRLVLEFSAGLVTSWFGHAVDSISADGIQIDSESFDIFKPYVWDELTSIAAGSWTVQSRSVECASGGPPSPGSPTCNAGAPNFGVTPVPLPATLPMLALGIALLSLRARRSTS